MPRWLRPRLLLADEPLDGLDEAARAQWFADLDAFTDGGGLAVYTLHDALLLRAHADRILTLAPAAERDPAPV